MSPSSVPVPAHLGAVFRVRDARIAGLTPARLTASDLDRPFWGVRTTTRFVVATLEQPERDALARARVLAYAPRMPPGSFFVLQSAALLYGLPVPVNTNLPVHIGVFRPYRAPRGHGVQGHQSPRHLVTIRDVDGVRATSPASTWAQLASVLSVRDLVAVGDAIVHVPRQRGGAPGDPASALGTIEQLAAAAAAGRRVGIDKLRMALPLIRAGASSRPETHLRLDLDDGVLPVPVLDFEVRDAAGSLLGISEFAYPGYRVAGEYEGDGHRTDKRQWNRDIEKYRAYAAAGWRTVRITSVNLYGDGVSPYTLVRQALLEAGWRPK